MNSILLPPGPEAVAILYTMGEIAEERIAADDQAIGYFRQALKQDPTHGPSLRALARMLRERSDWSGLVEVLELELTGLSESEAKARIAFRIGEICEQRLADVDRAMEYYRRALESAPGYRPVVDAVARLRSERSAWKPLVQELEREAETTPDPELAVAALMRQGEVWADELNDPRRAIDCYEAVLNRAPNHLGALLAVEPLYRRVESWEPLGQVYRQQARNMQTIEAKSVALKELGRLQELHPSPALGDPLESYRSILRLIPDDADSLDAMERIALERNDRSTLRLVDQARAEEPEDVASRAAHLTRLGETREDDGDAQGALEAYRAAADADPEALGAIHGLARLADATDDPFALAEAARREATISPDGTDAARLLVRSAAVRTERLDDIDGARSDLERALELCPENNEAAIRLGAMLKRMGEHARLADLLSRAATSARSPDRVAALWMQVAELQSDSLSNLPGAISSLNRVMRSAPSHVETLRRLAALYGRDNQWTEAANLWSRLIQLGPDRELLMEAHLALAEIWDERLGETARALVSLKAVLALDEGNRNALARLAGIQERQGKLDEASKTVERLVEASETSIAKADAHLRVARVRDAAGDREAATAALLDALALEGPGTESSLELKSRLESVRDWDRYVDALRRFLERGDSSDNPSNVYLELARVYHDILGRPNAALEILREGLDTLSDASLLRMDLCRRLRGAGMHDEAVRELVKVVRQDPGKTEPWRELARNFDELGRPDATRLALMPLVVLGSATEAERGRLEATAPRPEAAQPASLGFELLSQLGPKGRSEEAAEALLSGIHEGLAKLHRADLEPWGLTSRDRLTTRDSHPLLGLAERIAGVLGLESFELYVHRIRARSVGLELAEPPAILVPASVAELSEPEQVFILARPLIAIAKRIHAVEKLTPTRTGSVTRSRMSPGESDVWHRTNQRRVSRRAQEEDLQGNPRTVTKVGGRTRTRLRRRRGPRLSSLGG